MVEPTEPVPDDPDRGPGVGDLLLDRYELRRVLRVKPLGIRWLAWDRQLHRDVTVKLAFSHAAADPVTREWFRRESLATARVRHPNVANLYDAHASDQHVFVVLEHVDGVPLEDLQGRRLDPSVVAALGCQVADGLAAAHDAGVVHRDIAPPNLLVASTGFVKITNFSLSKLRDAAMDVTIEPTLREIFGYVAPEQLDGDEPTPASDLYGLGIVLWEALAGQLPFADDPLPTAALRRRDEALPDPVDADTPEVGRLLEVIARATCPDPDDRHASARELADELRGVCGPRPQTVTRTLLDLVASTGGI